MNRIQSVEISCLVHSTEDEARIAGCIATRMKVSAEPEREKLEGYFGNQVVHLRYHLVGEEAGAVFQGIVDGLEKESVVELQANLRSAIDEHSALYLRLSKQELVGGRLVLSSRDPVRVRVKPRRHMMRVDPETFYLGHLKRGL